MRQKFVWIMWLRSGWTLKIIFLSYHKNWIHPDDPLDKELRTREVKEHGPAIGNSEKLLTLALDLL